MSHPPADTARAPDRPVADEAGAQGELDALMALYTLRTQFRVHGQGATDAGAAAKGESAGAAGKPRPAAKRKHDHSSASSQVPPPPPPPQPSSAQPPGPSDASRTSQIGSDNSDAGSREYSEALQNLLAKKRKIHTVPIDAARMIKTFSLRLPSCPYPSCKNGTPCNLGMYYNTVTSTAPNKFKGRCLLWGHLCHACGGSYHQVENHGKPESYMAFRFNAAGHFIDPDDLQKVIADKASTIRMSYFGKPICNFGNIHTESNPEDD